ncbi:hypothetical protein A4D02_13795 [Niastella koreensis]|uniref:Uncharacterized protein n=2 Tax=Niastella koreensis TaxID=354356 RepID=G8TQ26_NIAKG|nr:hypothetical protein [Niastella koreensis]AEW01027.1 hypothetical protein Niako_4776 [Niastella koreensis GR20-10]OQP42632.1 hypothetical protein A4D02_13795 [Niastella koreensis]
MSKKQYTINENVAKDQAELMLRMFKERLIERNADIEVYISICEILYQNGFRANLLGMHNQDTSSNFSWHTLIKYKNVVDFQIDHLLDK